MKGKRNVGQHVIDVHLVYHLLILLVVTELLPLT